MTPFSTRRFRKYSGEGQEMTRTISCYVTLGALLWLPAGSVLGSSGLVPPLKFGRPDDRTWKVELRVERDDVERLTVERSVYRSGDLLLKESVPLLYTAGVTRVLDIPFEFDGRVQLLDGAYAEVLEAQGVPTRESGVGFVVAKTVYFVVESGSVRFVSQEDYSRRVQQVDAEIGSGGAPRTRFLRMGGDSGTASAAVALEAGAAIQIHSGHVPRPGNIATPQSEKDER